MNYCEYYKMNRIFLLGCLGCLIGFSSAALPPPDCLVGSIPSPKDPFVDCCKVNVFANDVIMRCKQIYPPHPPAQNNASTPIKGCCLAECALNDTKILTNGTINKQIAVTYLSSQVGNDDESKKIITNAVDFCTSQATIMKKDFDNLAQQPLSYAGPRVCSLYSGYFLGCVSANIYKNCPRTKYLTGDAECDKIKTFANRCNILWPKKQLV